MTPLVEARAVSYRIGAKSIVEGVTLAVPAGHMTVVVGPNGAGKSTLVKLMSGEIRPSSGAISYGGEPLGAIPGWRLACLRAVLPQASRLAFPFTAGEVVRIGLAGIGRGLTGQDRAGLLTAALERADVSHLSDRTYQSLSGGEQQRTQFARILAQLWAGRTVAPRQVLFLDEPIASLDLKHQVALLEEAAGLAAEGVGVVAVLHDLNLAATFADEIVAMSGGRIAARGSPAEVVCDRVVAEVFGIEGAVGRVPSGDRPFILPRRRGESTSVAPLRRV